MNTSNRRFGAFSSSENPDELANRVKAVILGLSTIIIFIVTHLFHITFTADDVVTLATGVSGMVSAIWLAYGTIKAFIIWAIDKWHTQAV